MARKSNSGWSRPWSAFFAVIIVLGGVAISLGFGVRLRAALERNADTRMTTASTSVRTAVANELGRYADAVRLSAGALHALPEPTAKAFENISAAVGEQDLSAMRAMSFVAPAKDGMTARWRGLGATDFTPETAPELQEHFYTVYARGLGDTAAPPIGADQAAAQPFLDASRLAKENEQGAGVAVSDAYVRLADAGLPKAQQTLSFEVVAPVGDDGFVVLTIGAAEFVSTNLTRATGDLLDAQLLTRSGTGALTEVASVTSGQVMGFRRAENFVAGERQWVLRTSATYQSLLPNAGRTDLVVVIAGTTLAVMFGTLMYLQMSSTARAEREIAAEVAERLRKGDPATEQGRLLGALAAQEALLGGLLAPPGEPHPEVDLQAVVAEVVAGRPGVTVAEDLPSVRADAALLRHLLQTMVVDALSRTPEDEEPQVAVAAETADDGQVRLTVRSGGTELSCALPGLAHLADQPS
ncbi:hypothetical protein [Actinoplanes sp. NPDC051494]|uniref:hypothetical protein n=1 Tax=Actinoplanes sp. NPDC051494 TaxID=3363907 RepID=UPI003796FCA7